MADPVKDLVHRLPPRGQGALMLAVGLVLNVVMVFGVSHYLVVSLFVGPLLMLLGLWRTALGAPIDRYTGRAPRWFKAGTIACVAVGLAVSLLCLAVLNA
jgi:hypothetical protein